MWEDARTLAVRLDGAENMKQIGEIALVAWRDAVSSKTSVIFSGLLSFSPALTTLVRMQPRRPALVAEWRICYDVVECFQCLAFREKRVGERVALLDLCRRVVVQ